MIRSPIYFDKCRGCHIDLSQLAEVGPIFGMPLVPGYSQYMGNPHTTEYSVGFSYRFNNSPDWLHYRRLMREGPKRNEDLTLVDPSRALETVSEEYYDIVVPHPKWPGMMEHKSYVLVHSEKLDEPVVRRNLESERQRLINAWVKWKKIEPEIYAIIRKHLS